MSELRLQPFDRRQLKVNQVSVISLLLVAFLLPQGFQAVRVGIVALVALVMLGGTFIAPLALFRHLYFSVLKPAGIVKPDVIQDDPAPHRFANALGGIFVTLALASLVVGLGTLGWILAWIVIALASLNFAFNICVGCIMFHRLERFNLIPGRAA